MKQAFLKHIPKDSTTEEFGKTWDNAGYTLTPLYKLLKELVEENNRIKKDDFDCPNHYARLAFQAGENRAYAYILSLLPDSCKD